MRAVRVSSSESSKKFILTKVQSHCNLYRSTSGTYYVLVKRRGRQFRRSLDTKDPALAKRRLRDFLNQADRLKGGKADPFLTFEDLAERWMGVIRSSLKPSSFRRIQSAIHVLTPYFKGLTLRNIGLPELERWQMERTDTASPRTSNMELAILRNLFRYAQKELRILLDNPVEHLRKRKVAHNEKTIPTREQFRDIIATIRLQPKAGESGDLVEFLAYSGMRQAEATSVEWKHVSFDLNNILITGGSLGTKNSENRIIPLFPPLRRLLEDRLKAAGETVPRFVFSIKSARTPMATACRTLKMPPFSHHSLRHFFCSNCIEVGVDFKAIAAWLGHKDGGILVAKTYGHLRADHSSNMASRMNFDVKKPAIELLPSTHIQEDQTHSTTPNMALAK